ncbi:EF-hand domain-containing protein [Niveispirillum irakense]|uniref:EF-hand domain-containing protein n=1 Tax=Niveispirillum irakense TaxID=34011 RepID=UPI000418FBBD|nr:EF-hand domain-containing protein [Niveispirillum irakense]
MEINSSTTSLFQTASSRRPSPQERFEQTDTDKSGTLSLDEFKAGAPKGQGSGGNNVDQAELFTSMDADSNGELTQAEMESAFQRMGNGTRGALIDAQAGAGGPPPDGGAGGTSGSASNSGDIASLLSSSTDSEDEEEDDAISSLISQLRSAAASYGANASTGTAANSSIPGSLLA